MQKEIEEHDKMGKNKYFHQDIVGKNQKIYYCFTHISLYIIGGFTHE